MQDTLNLEYISTCNARSTVCIVELHIVTQILNRLHRIFYTSLRGVLLSAVHYNRGDSSYRYRYLFYMFSMHLDQFEVE